MINKNFEKATLAGGCFWCIESAFSNILGILSIRSGYTGGEKENPTYDEVCSGDTGHFEAVEIIFDPQQITFLQILEIFWRCIDPFDQDGQFADRGSQYRTAIFFHNTKQKQLAERSKKAIESHFKKTIATLILPAKTFYPAEDYHQGYCFKQPEHFRRYQMGHEKKLESIWKDQNPTVDDLKERLTPLQFHVTQEDGTEPPFRNAYWDNHKEGIYVDIITGEPLFSSRDKFDSGTGWPSFTQPLHPENLIENEDQKLGMQRTEVRGHLSNAHLGHLFPDGPKPTGMRYCMNSASLRFIPKEKLQEEGYGEYLSSFE